MPNRIAQVEVIVYKIIKKSPFFLLLKRSSDRGGFWQPITGGVNFGEKIKEAAKRELFEETQIKNYIQILENVYYFEYEPKNYNRTKEYVCAIQVEDGTEPVLSFEHIEKKWCNLEESLKFLKHDENKDAFRALYELINS